MVRPVALARKAPACKRQWPRAQRIHRPGVGVLPVALPALARRQFTHNDGASIARGQRGKHRSGHGKPEGIARPDLVESFRFIAPSSRIPFDWRNGPLLGVSRPAVESAERRGAVEIRCGIRRGLALAPLPRSRIDLPAWLPGRDLGLTVDALAALQTGLAWQLFSAWTGGHRLRRNPRRSSARSGHRADPRCEQLL